MDSSTDIWAYQDPATVEGADLIGYHVEAADGEIGKIDQASNSVASSFVVVDTGPWIFGKKVMLPAGVVTAIDHENKTVRVNRSKEQIKAAPLLSEDDDYNANDDYRNSVGSYYGPTGAGWQDW
jgi:hypothetical protein